MEENNNGKLEYQEKDGKVFCRLVNKLFSREKSQAEVYLTLVNGYATLYKYIEIRKRPCRSITLLHGRFFVVPLEESQLKFAYVANP